MDNGQILKFLIDTGSNKNYIRPDLVKTPIPNRENFYANSIAGKVEIHFHTNTFLFGRTDVPIKFFLLPNLKTFHGIIGNDTLKDLDAIIYTRHNYMEIGKERKILLKEFPTDSINMTSIRTSHMTQRQKDMLKKPFQHMITFFRPLTKN